MFTHRLLSFLSLCWWLAGTSAKAQDSIQLTLNIFPQNAVIKIGEQVIDLNQSGPRPKVTLAPGTYELRIWAPGRQLRQELLELEGQTVQVLYRNISKDYRPDFVEYQKQIKKHRSRQWLRWAAIGGLVAGNAWYHSRIPRERQALLDQEKQVDQAYDQYQGAISKENATTLYEGYLRAHTDFEDRRQNYHRYSAMAIPVALASTALSVYLVRTIRRKKATAPMPYQESAPFGQLQFQPPHLSQASPTPGSLHFILQF
ncbi:MAG: hypothetical protein AAFW73_15995 [Bacteroidota bacterium]